MATDLIERTVAYSLSLRGIGTSRQVPTGMVTTDAQEDRIRVSKKILECEELTKIHEIDRKLRNFVKLRSVSFPLKPGMYLVPVDMVAEVDAEVERQKPIRAALVDELSKKVDDLKKQDEEALKSLFNDADYSSAEQVKAAFSVETRYIALELPGNLSSASKKVFDRERLRIRGELEQAADEIRKVQRAQLTVLVDSLVERLSPGPEGKKRAIKQGGPLDKITEFLDRYGKLNVADDTELAEVVEKAKEVLSGVDAECLKSNDKMAGVVKAGMEQIRSEIEPLIKDVPIRLFRKTA